MLGGLSKEPSNIIALGEGEMMSDSGNLEMGSVTGSGCIKNVSFEREVECG